MRERTILLSGCSKSFAMTGFRVGYACAPAAIIEAMMKIHQYAIMCASIMSQEAAIEALDHCAKEVEESRNTFLERYHAYEIASAAFQIGIVLASAAVITRMIILVWLAGCLGAGGLVVMGLGLLAPHAIHVL